MSFTKISSDFHSKITTNTLLSSYHSQLLTNLTVCWVFFWLFSIMLSSCNCQIVLSCMLWCCHNHFINLLFIITIISNFYFFLFIYLFYLFFCGNTMYRSLIILGFFLNTTYVKQKEFAGIWREPWTLWINNVYFSPTSYQMLNRAMS